MMKTINGKYKQSDINIINIVKDFKRVKSLYHCKI